LVAVDSGKSASDISLNHHYLQQELLGEVYHLQVLACPLPELACRPLVLQEPQPLVFLLLELQGLELQGLVQACRPSELGFL
jgi:hypothetical protein